MAFRVTINSIKEKKFLEAVAKKANSPKTRSKMTKSVKDAVSRQIEDAIGGKNGGGNTKVAIAFQPHRQPDGFELIGRLGVGKDGEPNLTKLSNAWRQLIPKESRGAVESAASLTGTFSFRSLKTGRLGQFTYSLNIDKLYSSRLSTFGYFSRRLGPGEDAKGQGLVIIPWLKHFIEGVEIDGYGFSKKLTDTSRTGIGIMVKIPSGTFRISPRPYNPFKILADSIIRKARTKAFADDIKRAISESFK